MIYLICILAAALLLLAFRLWQRWRRTQYIFYMGWRVALNPQEKYVFTFRASFPTEDQAKACLSDNGEDGLPSKLEISPNGKRWVVSWQTELLGSMQPYQLIKATLDASVTRHEGGPLITSAGKDSGFGMFLAN